MIAYGYNMQISQSIYFGFIIPALIAMYAGILIPFKNVNKNRIKTKDIIKACRVYLFNKSSIGILLMIIGLLSGILEPFVPTEGKYILYLFSKLLYIGIFYIYFSEIKNKIYYIITGLTALLVQTILAGMFGDLVYTAILAILLLLIGKKINIFLKYFIVLFGLFLIIILQSIKSDFRNKTWHGNLNVNETNSNIFTSLLIQSLTNPSLILEKQSLMPMVSRFNQGMIQARVMEYVPKYRPYQNGTTIFNSVISTFVPRFLWPDKPEAGGKWNIEYFTGFKIEGYSMNIGPFGEAYGNFGVFGGIIFMFLYGVFFNLSFSYLFNLSIKRPTIILWFPILFLNSIQIETDILMTVNSLIKNCLFMAFCFWAADRFLRIQL
jgi:hypothetical protein